MLRGLEKGVPTPSGVGGGGLKEGSLEKITFALGFKGWIGVP